MKYAGMQVNVQNRSVLYAEPELALVPESFTADPELAELDVLQAVSADGWLAVSLGEMPAARAEAPAKVAAPASKRRALRR